MTQAEQVTSGEERSLQDPPPTLRPRPLEADEEFPELCLGSPAIPVNVARELTPFPENLPFQLPSTPPSRLQRTESELTNAPRRPTASTKGKKRAANKSPTKLRLPSDTEEESPLQRVASEARKRRRVTGDVGRPSLEATTILVYQNSPERPPESANEGSHRASNAIPRMQNPPSLGDTWRNEAQESWGGRGREEDDDFWTSRQPTVSGISALFASTQTARGDERRDEEQENKEREVRQVRSNTTHSRN